jgi:hypothetical protein
VRYGGKLYRRKLNTTDYKLARRKLAEFRNDLERTDATKGKTSLAKMLDAYEATLTGAASTLEKKRAVVAKLRQNVVRLRFSPLAHHHAFAGGRVAFPALRIAKRQLPQRRLERDPHRARDGGQGSDRCRELG